MTDGPVNILDGNTFVVSDKRGDIEASGTDPTGLFSWDTRYLSTWRLTLDGKRLTPLSVDDLQYFEAKFFLVPETGTVYSDSEVSVMLRNYGYRQEAAQIAADMLDAAAYFNGRLPEAFAGYHRAETRYPVEYPTACSPQAWSTGAPLLFLRTMLGMDPSGEHLVVEPAVPNNLGALALLDIPGRWGPLDAFGRGLITVDREHPRPSPVEELRHDREQLVDRDRART